MFEKAIKPYVEVALLNFLPIYEHHFARWLILGHLPGNVLKELKRR